MRDLFRGYYRPKKEEFDSLWDNCIFSFDTNILLNVYRYTPKTRERFFDILNELQERIWLPYQVAYEYQEERLNVISQQLKPYSELQESLDDHLKKIHQILYKYSNRHSFSDFVDIKKLIRTLERTYNRVKKNLAESRSNYPNLCEQDIFREKLTDLFEGKVGQPYSEEDLAKIYREVEKRFKDNLPPGYMDSRGSSKKEPSECYGDVVIWFQLIDYAKKQKKPLIFVTDDQKEDWWLERRGKILGPRPELIQEIYEKANVSFYLYTGERFLDQAGIFLSLSSEPEVVEEARKIRLQDNEKRLTQDTASLLRQIEQMWSMSDPRTQYQEQMRLISDHLAQQREHFRLAQEQEQMRLISDPRTQYQEQMRSILDHLAQEQEQFRLISDPRAKYQEQMRSILDHLAQEQEQFRSMLHPLQGNNKNIDRQTQVHQDTQNQEEINLFDDQLNDEQTGE